MRGFSVYMVGLNSCFSTILTGQVTKFVDDIVEAFIYGALAQHSLVDKRAFTASARHQLKMRLTSGVLELPFSPLVSSPAILIQTLLSPSTFTPVRSTSNHPCGAVPDVAGRKFIGCGRLNRTLGSKVLPVAAIATKSRNWSVCR